MHLRDSPAAAAVSTVLSGSLADWESVSPFPDTSSSVPPACAFPPPDSLAPAVTWQGKKEVNLEYSHNLTFKRTKPIQKIKNITQQVTFTTMFTGVCPERSQTSYFSLIVDMMLQSPHTSTCEIP